VLIKLQLILLLFLVTGAIGVYYFAASYLKQKCVRESIAAIFLAIIRMLSVVLVAVYGLSLIKPQIFTLALSVLGFTFFSGIAVFLIPAFISNIIGWLFIKYYVPFNIDDFVQVNHFAGIVKKHSLLFIVLKDYETSKEAMISNANFLVGSFNNFSRQKFYFIDFTLIINEVVDVMEFKKVLITELGILSIPKPDVSGVINFNNSSSTMKVKCYLLGDDYSTKTIYDEIYEKIKKITKSQFLELTLASNINIKKSVN
jgi:hypothetical protein